MITDNKKVQLWNLIHAWLQADVFFNHKADAYKRLEDFVFADQQEEKIYKADIAFKGERIVFENLTKEQFSYLLEVQAWEGRHK